MKQEDKHAHDILEGRMHGNARAMASGDCLIPRSAVTGSAGRRASG